MGRIRTIKPDFHTSEALSALPAEAHLLASGLLCYADDEGYFDANPKLVAAAVFPLRDLEKPIETLMEMLVGIEYIKITSVKGKSVGHVVTFTTHQRVNRPTPSRLKPHVQLTASSLPEGKGREGEEEGKVDESITPEMVTRGVMSELCLSTRDLAVSLDGVCRSEMKQGREATELRDELIGSWREYDKAKPDLSYFSGATKFFGEGIWKNKAAWPWKDGRKPAGRKYVND